MSNMLKFAGAFVLCCSAVLLQIFVFSPISPAGPLKLPSLNSAFPSNKKLQRVEKLGFLNKPEAVCVDDSGVVYTATRDGWIKRRLLRGDGSWESWKRITESDALLGIAISRNGGGIVVCDSEQGLVKVTDEGVSVLASHDDANGHRIRFADDVIEGSDGSLYFSVASTKFGLHNWFLDVLEAKPHGQLLKHDPSTNLTSILLTGLGFANGVALSQDERFLIVCETWKFRCLKYWLTGDLQGQTEVFVDDLPGAPDNINLAPDGSFWIALLQLTKPGFEFVHTSFVAKHIVATFPALLNLVNGVYGKATVVNVAANGNITRSFDDPDGSVMSFVTSALEFEDHLYLGSLSSNFVGKLPLK